MLSETEKTAVKLEILATFARLGVTPGDVGREIKLAAIKRADGILGLLSGGGAAAANAANAGLDFGRTAASTAAAIALGLGGLTGYVAENLFGPNETDVEHARAKNRIEMLRRSQIRLDAEQKAMDANLKGEDEDDEQSTKGRRPATTIQTAV